jgi:hypothetical protein
MGQFITNFRKPARRSTVAATQLPPPYEKHLGMGAGADNTQQVAVAERTSGKPKARNGKRKSAKPRRRK